MLRLSYGYRIMHQFAIFTKRFKSRHAFSLIEMTVAMVVLAVGTFSTGYLMQQGSSGQRDVQDQTEATTIARTVLQEARSKCSGRDAATSAGCTGELGILQVDGSLMPVGVELAAWNSYIPAADQTHIVVGAAGSGGVDPVRVQGNYTIYTSVICTGPALPCTEDGTAGGRPLPRRVRVVVDRTARPAAPQGLVREERIVGEGAAYDTQPPSPGVVATPVFTSGPTPAPSKLTSTAFNFNLSITGGQADYLECSLDSAAYAECNESTPVPTMLNYTGLLAGNGTNHTLSVRAGAGAATSIPVDYAWYAVTPSQPSITAAPPTTATSYTSDFTIAYDYSSYDTRACRLDSGLWTACTTSASYTGLVGSHTFTVRAITAGVTRMASASWYVLSPAQAAISSSDFSGSYAAMFGYQAHFANIGQQSGSYQCTFYKTSNGYYYAPNSNVSRLTPRYGMCFPGPSSPVSLNPKTAGSYRMLVEATTVGGWPPIVTTSATLVNLG